MGAVVVNIIIALLLFSVLFDTRWVCIYQTDSALVAAFHSSACETCPLAAMGAILASLTRRVRFVVQDYNLLNCNLLVTPFHLYGRPCPLLKLKAC